MRIRLSFAIMILRLPAPLLLLLIGLLSLLLQGCGEDLSQLERIKQRGEIIVVTRISSTTYFQGRDGPHGLEYDLVRRFADHLGVDIRFVIPEEFTDLLPMVESGTVDLAAAGLSITERRKRHIRFGPPYQKVTPLLVYRAGTKKPKKLSDLANGDLEIVAGSSHEEALRDRRRREYPTLSYTAHTDVESEELLEWVSQGLIDYTIADSNQFSLSQRVHPKLRSAFEMHKAESLAWALRKSEDDSLMQEVRRFFKALRKSGDLDQLIDQHYGYTKRFDPFDLSHFKVRISTRLSKYQNWFHEAQQTSGFDWRLLAAVGYQESHWNPKAVSPTGVRGLMMLTRATAKRVGVKNRKDAKQSITGGARYLRIMHDTIPKRIAEPDRTWLALAGYNVGFGHLEDARRMCQSQGKNPDRWSDVKQCLPLLSKKKWYRKTRYGYARGWEPVRYVESIRSYYEQLKIEFREPLPSVFDDRNIDPAVL